MQPFIDLQQTFQLSPGTTETSPSNSHPCMTSVVAISKTALICCLDQDMKRAALPVLHKYPILRFVNKVVSFLAFLVGNQPLKQCF